MASKSTRKKTSSRKPRKSPVSRKPRKSPASFDHLDTEALGLVLLAVGIFIAGLLLPILPTGEMGLDFRLSFYGTLGRWGAFVLPWPFIATGGMLMFRRDMQIWPRLLLGYGVMCAGIWFLLAMLIPFMPAAEGLVGLLGIQVYEAVSGLIGGLGLLLAFFLMSIGGDILADWPPSTLARQALRRGWSLLSQGFTSFLALRKRLKARANFQADMALVHQELRALDRDLDALGVIHSGDEEQCNIKRWHEAIQTLRQDLHHADAKLLADAQEATVAWRDAVGGLTAESAAMLGEAMRQELISDFEVSVPRIWQKLQTPFVGDIRATRTFERQRERFMRQLEMLEAHYSTLMLERDAELEVLSDITSRRLAKVYEGHVARLGGLTELASAFEHLERKATLLEPWYALHDDICTLCEAFPGHEALDEFMNTMALEWAEETEHVLGHVRLVHWQQQLELLGASLNNVDAPDLADLPEDDQAEQSMSELPEQDDSVLTAEIPLDFQLPSEDELPKEPQVWQTVGHPLDVDDLDPEMPLEEVPKTMVEAQLKQQPKTEETAGQGQAAAHPVADIQVALERPPMDFLEIPKETGFSIGAQRQIKARGEIINRTISNFRLKGTVQLETSQRGPTVTRFEVRPGEGEKISRYASLSDDIALAMGVASVRIEAPIQGKKDIIGLEVPNETRDMVRFREALESSSFKKESGTKGKLPVVLGKSIEGDFWVANLGKMPHLLIAGSTGSGKSVAVNTLIVSLLYQFLPLELRFLMIDPKMVELTPYDGIPHLLRSVVTNPNDAAGVLLGAVAHMERRYKMMSKIGAKSLEQYNKKARELDLPEMPFIVIIIDELADLMVTSPKEVEGAIMRLAQMARATGMHLILATQRPSVDILTSLIKVNVPARMAFAVSSSHDSRTILDSMGAERLTGMGDMLYYQPGLVKPARLQGPFISENEIHEIGAFLRLQTPHFDDEFVEAYGSDFDPMPEESIGGGLIDWNDDKLREAAELVIAEGQASVSRLQRRLSVGHARAGKLMDSLEALAIVGPHQGSKPREVMVTMEDLPNILGP